MSITINNSKEASVTGQWSNPGAGLFDKLLVEPNYKALIREAYIRVPGEVTTESTYSGSGVGYPHHVIRNGKLVLHRRGVVAAYSRMKQQGIFTGPAAAHIERHYRELGLYEDSTMEAEHSDVFSPEDFINGILKNPQREKSGNQNKLEHSTIKSAIQKMIKLRAEYPDIEDWQFGRMMEAANRIKMSPAEIRSNLSLHPNSNMELTKFVDIFINYIHQAGREQERAVAVHSAVSFESYLEHHGVPGMQWGVRRKRGPDGRRTGPPMSTEEYKRRQAARQAGEIQQDTRSEDKRAADEARRKRPAEMSNAEMKRIVDRLNLERQHTQLTTPEKTRGQRIMERAMKELEDVAWGVAKTQLTRHANRLFEEMSKKGS